MLEYLIAAHCLGDGPLQNHWMQGKTTSTVICLAHIAAYSVPFWGLCAAGVVPLWAVMAVLMQHYLQDRYQLHRRWMTLCRQTPPEQWPVGPIYMDQCWHIAFMGLVALVAR